MSDGQFELVCGEIHGSRDSGILGSDLASLMGSSVDMETSSNSCVVGPEHLSVPVMASPPPPPPPPVPTSSRAAGEDLGHFVLKRSDSLDESWSGQRRTMMTPGGSTRRMSWGGDGGGDSSLSLMGSLCPVYEEDQISDDREDFWGSSSSSFQRKNSLSFNIPCRMSVLSLKSAFTYLEQQGGQLLLSEHSLFFAFLV